MIAWITKRVRQNPVADGLDGRTINAACAWAATTYMRDGGAVLVTLPPAEEESPSPAPPPSPKKNVNGRTL